MNKTIIASAVKLSEAVKTSIANNKPVLALESTVITHGLPYPQNIEIARELESLARKNGVTPATIVFIDGDIHIGLEDYHLSKLSALTQSDTDQNLLRKIALRDIPLAVAQKWSGGTTVSATMFLAYQAGIRVFATGGIGGVHRGWQDSMDISADMQALASYPVIVVTAGCKAILDIPATLEHLESLSVPVYGWETNICPAFYSQKTPFTIDKTDSAKVVADAYKIMTGFPNQYNQTGIIVMNPIPDEFNIPNEQIEPFIEQAVNEARIKGIIGKATTPWLLKRLSEITSGKSVAANLGLIKNNVLTACEIARELVQN